MLGFSLIGLVVCKGFCLFGGCFSGLLIVDMINMINLGYIPTTACFLHEENDPTPVIAVGSDEDKFIRIYDINSIEKDEEGNAKPQIIYDIHDESVMFIALNEYYGTVISIDADGIIKVCWFVVLLIFSIGTQKLVQLALKR